MSVQKLGDGRYKVRWRDMGHHRARVFAHKRDAESFDAEIKRRQRLGEVGIVDHARTTLTELHRDWVERHVRPNLARSTADSYDTMWRAHIEPRLGKARLGELTPDAIERFVGDLRRKGVGDASIRRCLVILGAMFGRAVAWGRMARNPVAVVSKPSTKRKRTVVALAPSGVEAIRSKIKRQGDRTLVSVLAYAGLRPGEALALTWDDVRENTILVDKSISSGEEKATKTGRSRTVDIDAPLKQDLLEWKMASGRPGDRERVFPMTDGRPWSDSKFRNWRSRTFEVAVTDAGLTRIRPYDLRHARASLLIHSGMSVVEVAAQMGHSPSMTLSTYSHVIAELRSAARVSAEDAILAARNGASSAQAAI